MNGLLRNRWSVSLFIIAAYLATGEPALMLAKSSGYATPFFPPAGIAIAFCFIIGFEILPAVFVAAFLLNFWIGFSKTFHIGTIEVAAGLLLAAASTLQAAIGGTILRRLIGYPAPLDSIRDLARFLLISPVACLVSSSFSTLSLHWLGAIPSAEVMTGWSAWWLGDTLGVVTFLPLIMVLFGEPRPIWRKRAFTVAIPMMLAFTMFILVFLQTSRWEKGESLAAFRHESQKAGESIDNNLQAKASLLEAIGAVMATREKMGGEELGSLSQDMLHRNPMIRGLGFVSTKSGYPVLYLAGEPDFNPENPRWKSTLILAGAGSRVVSSAPFDKGRLLAALKVDGRGIIVAMLGVRQIIRDAAGSSIHARFTDLSSGVSLYDDFPPGSEALSTHVFDFGGRQYAFESVPTAAYLSSHRAWQSWAVLAIGIFGSAMLGAFLLLSTGYTDRIEREVKERTDEVRQSEFLYHQMFETNAAIKLVIDPEDGKIIDANQAAAEFYGYPKNQLISMGIDDINVLPVSALLSEAALAKTGRHLFDCRHRIASGEVRDVEVYSGPVDLDGKKVLYSIVHDITDRKQTEESLRLFTSIYEASSEAVMVVDKENRIKTVNPAFTEITGYALDEVKGKDPNLLGSGRHDDAFYKEMWRSLEIYGHWQGEIWDKRKNGEVFPEWLTINTIYDKNGDVRERVALFSDITKRKAAETQVWRQANFDELTGLPNRNMFRDRLEFEIRKSSRSRHAFALLFIDLDRFKEVNDTLGHETGDRLLMEAAGRIASSVRESDTVARLGGDEFTVILSDLEENVHVEQIANSIIQKLAQPFNLGGEHAYVSGSIGITLYPNDGKESSELLKHADQAMYVAKSLGKNRFAYFTPELQDAAVERMKLIGELRKALSNGEFSLVFQPIVSLSSGSITKAEALLRWNNQRRGMVSPVEFIPLAEETGIIHEIGDWVFMEAAQWAKRWQAYRKNFQISINVSPVQLMAQSACHSWPTHLEEIGLSGEHIVVEITEGVLLNASESVADKLMHFRDAGIHVAIDDFGTGYSALAYLKKFDIDYLKIDKSFISEIDESQDDFALSRAIVAMAHSLAMEVIAEGVETETQKEILPEIRCDYAQGYLFSRPLPPSEFEKLLESA